MPHANQGFTPNCHADLCLIFDPNIPASLLHRRAVKVCGLRSITCASSERSCTTEPTKVKPLPSWQRRMFGKKHRAHAMDQNACHHFAFFILTVCPFLYEYSKCHPSASMQAFILPGRALIVGPASTCSSISTNFLQAVSQSQRFSAYS